MQSLIVAFVSVCGAAVASARSDATGLNAVLRVQRATHHILQINKLLQRDKRQTQDPANTCIQLCTEKLTEGLGDQFQETSSGMLNPQFYDPTMFTKFCSVYVTGKQCIDGCNFSALKMQIETMFRPLDYLCVEHNQEFLTHSECFKKTQSIVQKTCNEECGDESTLTKLKTQQEEAQRTADFSKVKDAFSKMCKYLDCHLSCTGPILTKECDGRAPADFLIDFSRATFQEYENILRNAEGMDYWPQSCIDLTKGQISISPTGERLKGGARSNFVISFGFILGAVLCVVFLN